MKKKKYDMGGVLGPGPKKTKLSKQEEQKFQEWYRNIAAFKGLGNNPDAKEQYYDYRGFWKEQPASAVAMLKGDREAHFYDTYKLPGHPTFSTESKYSNELTQGGEWKKEKGNFVFHHSPFTQSYADKTAAYLQQHGEGETAKQIGKLEPMKTVKSKDINAIIKPPKKYNYGGSLSQEPPQGDTLRARNVKAMINIPDVLGGGYGYVPESYQNMVNRIILDNVTDNILKSTKHMFSPGTYGSFSHSSYSKSSDKVYEKKNGGTLEPGPKGVKPPSKAKTHPRWEVGYKDPAWENVVEGLPLPLIAYPATFMAGIDDVVRSYKDPSHTKFDTALEVAGILPIVGNKIKHINRVADYISKDVVAPIVKKLPLWYADMAQKAGNAVEAGFDIYNDNISGTQPVNQKPAPRMKEYQYGGMLDSSSKDYINKKWKYAEGGALDAVLPAVPALLGAINPALGAVAGVGVGMYKQSQAQQEMDAQQGQRMVNTNPYGYASGGALQTASPGSRGRRKKFNAFPALLTAAAAGLGAAALYRQNNMAAQHGMQERLNQQPMPAQLMAPAQPVQPVYSEAFSPVSNQMMDTMGTGLPSYVTYAEKGGMLTGREGATMFVGDKHSAPSGGIAVTPNGVPMPASNQLVEGGEVSYKLRDGRTYIFSEKLKI